MAKDKNSNESKEISSQISGQDEKARVSETSDRDPRSDRDSDSDE